MPLLSGYFGRGRFLPWRLPLKGSLFAWFILLVACGALLLEMAFGSHGIVGCRMRGGLLIVGVTRAGRRLARHLAHPEMGLDVVGFLDDDLAGRGGSCDGVPVLGAAYDVVSVLGSGRVTEVAIMLAAARAPEIEGLLEACTNLGVPVSLVSDGE